MPKVSKRSRKRKMKKDLVDESVGNDVITQNEVTGEPEGVNILGKEKSVGHDSVGNGNEEPSQVSPHTESGAEMENVKSNRSEVEKNVSHEIFQGTDNSSSDEQPIVTDEVDFKMSTLVSALSNQTIIKNLCWLLKFYKSNSPGTNHYIISMLRRVCEDLELSPMLYQVSIKVFIRKCWNTFVFYFENKKKIRVIFMLSEYCYSYHSSLHFTIFWKSRSQSHAKNMRMLFCF